MSKKLFFSLDKKRQFLLNENTPVLEGDFVIKGTDGEKLNVDVNSINKLEISKEEANAWLKDQLKTVMGQLKTGLKETLFNSSPKKKDANESEQFIRLALKPLRQSDSETSLTSLSAEAIADSFSSSPR